MYVRLYATRDSTLGCAALEVDFMGRKQLKSVILLHNCPVCLPLILRAKQLEVQMPGLTSQSAAAIPTSSARPGCW